MIDNIEYKLRSFLVCSYRVICELIPTYSNNNNKLEFNLELDLKERAQRTTKCRSLLALHYANGRNLECSHYLLHVISPLH